jgi:hypothetical protein
MRAVLRIIFLVAFSIFVGCTTTDYVGKTYSKTDRVEIYFNTDEIKRPYEVMGQIKAEAPEAVRFEDMEKKLVEDAMAREDSKIWKKNWWRTPWQGAQMPS